MKTKIYSILFSALTLSCVLTLSCCKNDSGCPSTNAKVYITNGNSAIPYQGNEHLKFLHNNTDTQIFIAQGKETYYITEGITQEGECNKDYESIRVKFLNQTTNDILEYRYERDKSLFGGGARVNLYTGFKFLYLGKLYINEFFIASDSLLIGNQKYPFVAFYGIDTDNYIARSPLGILRIRVNNENWDLIP
jgi:hypothetical protein